MQQQNICLVMIVRDEAKYIERCLRSALPFCRYAVICDTGSTDDTVKIANAIIPWVVIRREWVDFATNRNQAIDEARQLCPSAEWFLFLDGDEELVGQMPALDPHQLGYNVQLDSTFRCFVPRLVNAQYAWAYVGACHEYITGSGIETTDMTQLEGIHIQHLEDGSRREVKLQRNLVLLQKAYALNPDDPRTIFYMAETHFCLGAFDTAAVWYLRRMEAGGWDEEVFYATYKHALCRVNAGRTDAPNALLDAYSARPSRAEPLMALAKLCRDRKNWAAMHIFTSKAITIPMTTDTLFVDVSAYEWDAPIEHGIGCIAIGKYKDAVEILASLQGKDGPPELRKCAQENFKLALSKL
jgi:hypothetical protein